MACAKELEEKFPFMDMKRVGMWGNSGGGYGTVSAMLLYPDFYKAGVASSGNYDQRMYEHSWTERYNGLYDPEVYELGDITRLAKNLKGKLFLAYGAMDDNVTMSQTLRLCDELNKYNKDYDLMVLPRMNHNVQMICISFVEKWTSLSDIFSVKNRQVSSSLIVCKIFSRKLLTHI